MCWKYDYPQNSSSHTKLIDRNLFLGYNHIFPDDIEDVYKTESVDVQGELDDDGSARRASISLFVPASGALASILLDNIWVFEWPVKLVQSSLFRSVHILYISPDKPRRKSPPVPTATAGLS